MNISTRAKWLTGIAAAIAGYVVLGPSNPGGPAEPTRALTAAVHSAHGATGGAGAAAVPLARSLLALSERVAGEGAAPALFAAQSWYVPPPPPPPSQARAAAATPAAPPKPVAPPLPFTYIGSYTPDGVAPVFFLTQGDRVYDVHVGDTLSDIYHVDAFTNGQLIFTYKPLNQQQELMTGGKP